jgi:enoyl-CoA hydratase
LSQKLSRTLGIYRAKELSLSGNFLDATTAERWGLLNRVVAPAELLPAAIKLAQDMATVEPRMSKAYKQLINSGHAVSFAEGMALEARLSREANSQVEAGDVEARRKAVMERGREQG